MDPLSTASYPFIRDVSTPTTTNDYDLIIFIILAFLAIVIIIYLFKNKKPRHKQVILMSDRNRMFKALRGAGITIYGKEDFENDNIVFDSIDKINKNFEPFLDYYIPLLEVNTINNIFKQFEINTTIQDEINNKELNVIKLFNEPYGFISQALLLAYSSKNATDIVLLGLCSALLMKLQSNLIKDYSMIYFDDYNKDTTDFVIYFVPPNYDKNTQSLRQDNNILDMNETNITGTEIFKLSLFNQMDKLLSVQNKIYKIAQIPVEERQSNTQNILYDEDKEFFVVDLYKNRDSIKINNRLHLVSLFSFINRPSSLFNLDVSLQPASTPLANYIIDRIFNNNYYTSTYYNYLTINIDKTNLNTINKYGYLLRKTSSIASNIVGVVVSQTPFMSTTRPVETVTTTSTMITPSTTTMITPSTTTMMTPSTTTTMMTPSTQQVEMTTPSTTTTTMMTPSTTTTTMMTPSTTSSTQQVEMTTPSSTVQLTLSSMLTLLATSSMI
jgi:hypothetical protein